MTYAVSRVLVPFDGLLLKGLFVVYPQLRGAKRLGRTALVPARVSRGPPRAEDK